MKTPVPLLLSAVALVVLGATGAAPASAAPSPLAAEPDPVVLAPASLSQCSSGYLCIWSLGNYTGTVQRFRTASEFSAVTVSRVGSVYNNRSQRAYLYENGADSTFACLGPGAKRPSVTGWLSQAETVYLSTLASR